MVIPGRSFSTTAYKWGFNGQEKDDEIKGAGNSLDFGARIYEPRLGTWMSVDPASHKYPDISPFCYAINNPIVYKDEGGKWITDVDGNPIYTVHGGKSVHLSPDKKMYLLFETRHYYTNDGQAVTAYVYTAAIKVENAVKVGKAIDFSNSPQESVPEELTYDCHGNTCFPNQNIYIPGSDEKGEKNANRIFINKSEYMYVKPKDAQEGDVKIFGNEEDDIINHSATRDTKGTYTTKDDRAPLREGATISEMAIDWGQPFFGLYRHKNNVNGQVSSDNGKVSEEVAKNAIENVTQ